MTSNTAQLELITSVTDSIFPDLTSNSSLSDQENILNVFTYLAKQFSITPTEGQLKRFREAVVEVSVAKSEACYGSSRLDADDIPELIQDFISIYNMDKRDGHQLRQVYGKLLCIKSTVSVNSTTRIRRDSHDCPCPADGFETRFEWYPDACYFFNCLDSEDTLKEIFFVSGEFNVDYQCLAFVIDTTGSMAGEIASAKRIILDFLRSEEEIGEEGCYILVPFNDVGPNHEIVHEKSKERKLL